METKIMKKNAFFAGYGKIFDPYNDTSRIRIKESSYRTDRENISKDWKNVGQSIKKAMNKYEPRQ